ncbi:MAG: hypothetical protein MUF10_20350, partial [Thermoanaerobaculaceae bacterium]|nr:hypothetical protein [Thermoanaerobaculaceae bacterium]
MAGCQGQAVTTLLRLGPLAVAAVLVLLLLPADPRLGVSRPAPEAAGEPPVLSGSLDPGRLRG